MYYCVNYCLPNSLRRIRKFFQSFGRPHLNVRRYVSNGAYGLMNKLVAWLFYRKLLRKMISLRIIFFGFISCYLDCAFSRARPRR